MIYPSPDTLDRASSKYALVIVAAKRARQIKDRARVLVDTKSSNPLTIALEELAAGQIVPLQVGEPERLPDAASAGPVLGGLLSTAGDDELTEHLAVSPLEVLVQATSSPLDDPEEVTGDNLDADLSATLSVLPMHEDALEPDLVEDAVDVDDAEVADGIDVDEAHDPDADA